MTDVHVTFIDAHGRPMHEYMGSAEHLQANAPAGCGSVPGGAEGDWWASDCWHHQPSRPSKYHQWDWPTHSWQDLRTPEQIAADAQMLLDAAWVEVRSRRDALLAKSDWTQLPDVSLATQLRWQPYRQSLRDISQQLDPYNIVWPVTPAEKD